MVVKNKHKFLADCDKAPQYSSTKQLLHSSHTKERKKNILGKLEFTNWMSHFKYKLLYNKSFKVKAFYMLMKDKLLFSIMMQYYSNLFWHFLLYET